MDDIFDNPIQVGDLCAISARNGKHDSVIKIFYVQEVLNELHPDYGTPHEYLRGFDGAGRFTQVQKSSNIVVVNGAVPYDHPRLEAIRQALSEDERQRLRNRLS